MVADSEPTPAWMRVACSAKPLLLVAIEFMMRTQKLAPYSTALNLLIVALDACFPNKANDNTVKSIQKTRDELAALGKGQPAKRRALLKKLRTQINAL